MVERPALGWWIGVIGGMTFLGLVAFEPRTAAGWSRRAGDRVPRRAYQALFAASLATHAAEAAVAARIARRAGLAVGPWTRQTLLLGYPSLRLLRRAAARAAQPA
ncbi:MAG: DUF4499 domain-containing protein [Acidimicrobiia bacterium]|nr:DUF4499 domain-containing protein [Acidimicrobiia bacterium]